MKNIIELLQSDRKWRMFGLILVAIIVIGTILSLITKLTLMRDDEKTRPRIAVVGPMTGALSPLGQALKQGAELHVEALNRLGGYKGRPIEVVAIEESADTAKNIVADPRVIAVIGYVDAARLKADAPVYAQRKLPLVTTLFLQEAVPGVTSLGIDTREQARFVANYARNVVQQRLMYVVREEGLVLGGSSGINVAAAIRLARELGPGHTIVTILCDGGARYQSKLFNPEFLRTKNLPAPSWM